MKIVPISQQWLDGVLPILREGDRTCIDWTYEAERDWGMFGIEQEAYEHLIRTLSAVGILGNAVVGMRSSRDMTYLDAWEFLCPHPWDGPRPLYAKIGIHRSRVTFDLISLHVDDGREILETAIKIYNNRHKS